MRVHTFGSGVGGDRSAAFAGIFTVLSYAAAIKRRCPLVAGLAARGSGVWGGFASFATICGGLSCEGFTALSSVTPVRFDAAGIDRPGVLGAAGIASGLWDWLTMIGTTGFQEGGCALTAGGRVVTGLKTFAGNGVGPCSAGFLATRALSSGFTAGLETFADQIPLGGFTAVSMVAAVLFDASGDKRTARGRAGVGAFDWRGPARLNTRLGFMPSDRVATVFAPCAVGVDAFGGGSAGSVHATGLAGDRLRLNVVTAFGYA